MKKILILLLIIASFSCTDGTSSDPVSFPQISAESMTVTEQDENSVINLELTLDKPFGQDVIINYSTSNELLKAVPIIKAFQEHQSLLKKEN